MANESQPAQSIAAAETPGDPLPPWTYLNAELFELRSGRTMLSVH